MAQTLLELLEALAKAGPAAQRLTQEALALLRLPPEGLSYLIETGISPPARKVGRKRRRNLIFDFPLRSIEGVVLQAESMTGEFNFLVELDRRNDLLAVFDQPITLNVEITDRIGRRTRSTHTADYLVVDQQRVLAYEIKADCELEKLIRDRPKDWTFDQEGYHYIPALKRFASMGIAHVIVPISSISPLRADNLRLLTNARDVVDTRRYRRARHGIRSILKREATMRVSDVLSRIGDDDETPILQLLDSNEIFADIDHVTLSDASSVWISTSLNSAKIAQESCRSLVETIHSLEVGTDDVIDPRYELEVATRLAIIRGVTRNNRKEKRISERTIRRYRTQLRRADDDPRSLTPRWGNCGSRGSLIGAVHLSLLEAVIRAGKGDRNDPSISSCFIAYKASFEGAKRELDFFDESPVSRSTFYTYWSRMPLKNKDSFNKGGRRLENQQSDSFDPGKKTLIATRPFAVAHIDHWKTDLYLVVGYVNGIKITKRAWLTAMVDAFDGEVLAIWLSFADPSKKACTMVIRDCVRRHSRLPEMVIVDGGSEFKSTHFFVMLATLKVVRCERPPEDPRFGQEVERLFKEFKDRFARGLPGFGISIERARAVSAAFKAAKSSTLTLMDAFEAIEAFTFQGFNNSPKPTEISSRHAIRHQEEKKYPHGGRRIAWDAKFLIATSIESPDSHYQLWPGRGIHVNDKWYSSPRLLAYRGYKKDISVRLEPYADSIIYVCIDGKWLECRNSEATLQAAMTEKSLLFKTAERQDLSALRAELTNDMNQYVARIVNEKLSEIAERSESNRSSPPPAIDMSAEEPNGTPTFVPFNFDDIAPYDNEAP